MIFQKPLQHQKYNLSLPYVTLSIICICVLLVICNVPLLSLHFLKLSWVFFFVEKNVFVYTYAQNVDTSLCFPYFLSKVLLNNEMILTRYYQVITLNPLQRSDTVLEEALFALLHTSDFHFHFWTTWSLYWKCESRVLLFTLYSWKYSSRYFSYHSAFMGDIKLMN